MCLHLPDVNLFLQFVDSCTKADDSEEFVEAQPTQITDKVSSQLRDDSLRAHGFAFDRGLISSAKMVEVLMTPFLKLAQKANREPYISNDFRCIDKLLIYWKKTLSKALLGEGSIVGNTYTHHAQMRPKKHAELVKALVAAKFPEVCQSL